MAKLVDGTRIYGNATVDSNLVINGGYAATSTTTGSLQLSGGAGITGNLYVGGNLSIAGNTTFINTTTITTTDTIAAPTINAGTIGNSGATLTGTLSTAAQTNITSVGTLTGLTLSGAINGQTINGTSILGTTIGNTASAINGNIHTGSAIYAGTIGNTGATFTGATFTAATSIIPASNNAVNLGGSSSQYYSNIWANIHYVGSSVLPGANIQANIGGVGSNYFNYIYGVNFVGTSTTAKYADLAEMYHSDNYYAPGTVIILGGDLDVTVSTVSHDTAVAGVVSTNPAYLMNDNFEHDNWLPVALTGRVPCLVRGPVNKGTLLVSSSERGVACALDKSLYEPGCVIGKSMDIILDDSIRKIEIAVGRF